MRILITGGAGFVGSHLWDALEAEGHDIVGVDNLATGMNRMPGVHRIDITERQRFYELANRHAPSLVIHCAASYKDPDKWHLDTRTNVEGCINAAAVAKHHGARLIYFQTILPPVSSYAISKLAGEQYLRLSGVPLTVFRLANIYGPRNLSGPVPVFYKRLKAGEPCTVVQTKRPMVYIDDLVRGVVGAINDDLTGTFDIWGWDKMIEEIFLRVGHEVGTYGEWSRVDPDGDDVQGTVSSDDGVPEWAPEVLFGEGIRRAVQWYDENGVGDTYTHLKLKG